MNKTLGIIAGSGVLPIEVAKAHISRGGKVHIAKLPGVEGDYTGYDFREFKIGEVGRLFDYFREAGAGEVVMIGGFKLPSLFGIKVDAKGAALLARITKAKLFGDDKLLRVVAGFIEENGFSVVSALSVLSDEITLKSGVIVGIVPRGTIENDIKIGLEAAKILGSKDLGQSIIVRSGIIVGEEDGEGTDALIRRCKGQGGVLVKAMKPMQDERLDIPTIGCDTVRNSADSGLDGIAIEAGKVIVVDRAAVIELANELGVFVVAI